MAFDQDTGTLVPHKGFVYHYVRDHVQSATGWLTDAPTTFHAACAYAQLATALQDCVAYPWAAAPLPPNLYLLLVANTTRHRKSTAIRLALDVLRFAEHLKGRIGPDECSAEGLLLALQDQPTLLLPIPEMADFLVTANTWGERLKPVLMSLSDAPSVYRKRLARATIEIEQPRISVLAAIALHALSEIRGTQLDWHSGFFARFMFVCPGSEQGAVLLDWENPELEQPAPARPGCLNALHERLYMLQQTAKATANGNVLMLTGMTEEARTVFRAWRAQINEPNTDADRDDERPEGQDRLVTGVLKIATLLAVDLTDGAGTQVDEAAMTYAVRFGEMSRRSQRIVWSKYAPTQDSRMMTKLYNAVRKTGETGIAHSVLLRNSHLRAKDFQELVETLRQADQIYAVALPNGGQVYRTRK